MKLEEPLLEGVKNKKDSESSYTGVRAILKAPIQSMDKFPMLEIFFKDFISHLSTALSNYTSEIIDTSIIETKFLRFDQYSSFIKNSHSAVLFKAEEWKNSGLIILENKMIFSLIELLLGGKKNINQSEELNLEKPLTSIEQELTKQISEIILNELGSSFAQVITNKFIFEKIENNLNVIDISPDEIFIILKAQIKIDNQEHNIDLLIPLNALAPIKEQMKKVYFNNKFNNDQEWKTLLHNSLNSVKLPIEAVITNKFSTIEEISKLKIGDTIIMDHAKDKDITIRSGPIELFTAKLGKVENKVAINLKKFID